MRVVHVTEKIKQIIQSRGFALFMTTFVLLGVVVSSDAFSIVSYAKQLRLFWLLVGGSLFVPLLMSSALRWQIMVSPWFQYPFFKSLQHTLAASSLNLIVPSKLGDLGKAGFLSSVNPISQSKLRNRSTTLYDTASLVLLEKILDLSALLFLCAIGAFGTGKVLLGVGLSVALSVMGFLLFDGCRARKDQCLEPEQVTGGLGLRERIFQLLDRIKSPLRQWQGWTFGFFLGSLLMWVMHLMQIGVFFLACGVTVSVMDIASNVPLAIIAGLVPITIAGIGVRDSALVVLFFEHGPAAQIALVGMLTSLRYLIPGLMGLPFLYQSLRSQRGRDQKQKGGQMRIDQNHEKPLYRIEPASKSVSC